MWAGSGRLVSNRRRQYKGMGQGIPDHNLWAFACAAFARMERRWQISVERAARLAMSGVFRGADFGKSSVGGAREIGVAGAHLG